MSVERVNWILDRRMPGFKSDYVLQKLSRRHLANNRHVWKRILLSAVNGSGCKKNIPQLSIMRLRIQILIFNFQILRLNLLRQRYPKNLDC